MKIFLKGLSFFILFLVGAFTSQYATLFSNYLHGVLVNHIWQGAPFFAIKITVFAIIAFLAMKGGRLRIGLCCGVVTYLMVQIWVSTLYGTGFPSSALELIIVGVFLGVCFFPEVRMKVRGIADSNS